MGLWDSMPSSVVSSVRGSGSLSGFLSCLSESVPLDSLDGSLYYWEGKKEHRVTRDYHSGDGENRLRDLQAKFKEVSSNRSQYQEPMYIGELSYKDKRRTKTGEKSRTLLREDVKDRLARLRGTTGQSGTDEQQSGTTDGQQSGTDKQQSVGQSAGQSGRLGFGEPFDASAGSVAGSVDYSSWMPMWDRGHAFVGGKASGSSVHVDQSLWSNIGKNWLGYKILFVWKWGEDSQAVLERFCKEILKPPFSEMEKKMLQNTVKIALVRPGDMYVFSGANAHMTLGVGQPLSLTAYESFLNLNPRNIAVFRKSGRFEHFEECTMDESDLEDLEDDVLDNIEGILRRLQDDTRSKSTAYKITKEATSSRSVDLVSGNLASGNLASGNLASGNSGNLASDNSGNLASDNSGNLASDNSGNLASDNSGNLASDNSGNLASDNSGNLASGPSGPPPNDLRPYIFEMVREFCKSSYYKRELRRVASIRPILHTILGLPPPLPHTDRPTTITTTTTTKTTNPTTTTTTTTKPTTKPTTNTTDGDGVQSVGFSATNTDFASVAAPDCASVAAPDRASVAAEAAAAALAVTPSPVAPPSVGTGRPNLLPVREHKHKVEDRKHAGTFVVGGGNVSEGAGCGRAGAGAGTGAGTGADGGGQETDRKHDMHPHAFSHHQRADRKQHKNQITNTTTTTTSNSNTINNHRNNHNRDNSRKNYGCKRSRSTMNTMLASRNDGNKEGKLCIKNIIATDSTGTTKRLRGGMDHATIAGSTNNDLCGRTMEGRFD